MFNRRRNVGLYYALGIAGFVALAGAGTFLLVSRRRNVRMREMSAQAKRVIQRTASGIEHREGSSTSSGRSRAEHHPKRTRSNAHSKSHNART